MRILLVSWSLVLLARTESRDHFLNLVTSAQLLGLDRVSKLGDFSMKFHSLSVITDHPEFFEILKQ